MARYHVNRLPLGLFGSAKLASRRRGAQSPVRRAELAGRLTKFFAQCAG